MTTLAELRASNPSPELCLLRSQCAEAIEQRAAAQKALEIFAEHLKASSTPQTAQNQAQFQTLLHKSTMANAHAFSLENKLLDREFLEKEQEQEQQLAQATQKLKSLVEIRFEKKDPFSSQSLEPRQESQSAPRPPLRLSLANAPLSGSSTLSLSTQQSNAQEAPKPPLRLSLANAPLSGSSTLSLSTQQSNAQEAPKPPLRLSLANAPLSKQSGQNDTETKTAPTPLRLSETVSNDRSGLRQNNSSKPTSHTPLSLARTEAASSFNQNRWTNRGRNNP